MIAGKEYGSGSSRDWAAKGPRLLGVRAVIARELRAHPPLEPGRDGRRAAPVPPTARAPQSLGLTGTRRSTSATSPRARGPRPSRRSPTTATRSPSRRRCGSTRPRSGAYYRHGGILHFVLRQLARRANGALSARVANLRASAPLALCAMESRSSPTTAAARARAHPGGAGLACAPPAATATTSSSRVDQHTADAGSELFENERDQSMITRLEQELAAIDAGRAARGGGDLRRLRGERGADPRRPPRGDPVGRAHRRGAVAPRSRLPEPVGTRAADSSLARLTRQSILLGCRASQSSRTDLTAESPCDPPRRVPESGGTNAAHWAVKGRIAAGTEADQA